MKRYTKEGRQRHAVPSIVPCLSIESTEQSSWRLEEVTNRRRCRQKWQLQSVGLDWFNTLDFSMDMGLSRMMKKFTKVYGARRPKKRNKSLYTMWSTNNQTRTHPLPWEGIGKFCLILFHYSFKERAAVEWTTPNPIAENLISVWWLADVDCSKK